MKKQTLTARLEALVTKAFTLKDGYDVTGLARAAYRMGRADGVRAERKYRKRDLEAANDAADRHVDELQYADSLFAAVVHAHGGETKISEAEREAAVLATIVPTNDPVSGVTTYKVTLREPPEPTGACPWCQRPSSTGVCPCGFAETKDAGASGEKRGGAR